MGIVITLIVLVLVIAYICCGFRIVPQNNEGLVETLVNGIMKKSKIGLMI